MNQPTDDFELDRKLAQGRPAGAEREALWSRVSTTLRLSENPHNAPAPAAARPGFLRRHFKALALGFAPTMAAATALILLTINPRQHLATVDNSAPIVASRGAASDSPRLEATCGSAESPCRVGDVVSLRLHNARAEGYAAVVLEFDNQRQPIYGPVFLVGDQSVAIPAQLVVEERDGAQGIHLVSYFVASSPIETGPSTSMEFTRSLDALRGHSEATQRTLVLKVVKP
jgi:hypothetical protein